MVQLNVDKDKVASVHHQCDQKYGQTVLVQTRCTQCLKYYYASTVARTVLQHLKPFVYSNINITAITVHYALC